MIKNQTQIKKFIRKQAKKINKLTKKLIKRIKIKQPNQKILYICQPI